MKKRLAAVAFPASAIVILASAVIQGFSGIEVPEEAAAAATGLLTWGSYVLFSAGEKAA